MDERPDHALVLDLTEVLREFSDRQRDVAAVLRHLRLARTSDAMAQRPTVLPAIATEGARSPLLAFAPPALAPPASTPQPPRPPDPPPEAHDPGSQVPVPVELAPETPRPQRDYDYFDELDERLAHLRRDQRSDSG